MAEETQNPDDIPEETAENTMLQEAIDSLHKNDDARARDLLTRLLKTDQENPDYWIWLSAAVDSPKERVYCLQTALKLDPENVSAKRGLVLLGGIAPDDSTPPFRLQKRQWEETLAPEAEKPGGFKAAWGNPVARSFIILALGVAVIGLLGLGFLLRKPASVLPTRTPGPSPTFTSTPTLWGDEGEGRSSATPTFIGPTPLWMLLSTPYTPTPRYVATDHPPVSSGAFRAALISFDKGEYETAIFQFQQVISMEPKASDAYYYIGECYMAMGKYPEALKAYQKSVELTTDFVAGYVGQAKARLAINPKADIRVDLDQALSFDRNYEPAYILRARYYLIQQKPEQALIDLEIAIGINPNDPFCYLYQAEAYLALEQNAEALEAALKANEMDITLLQAYLVLGQAYNANGRAEEAIAPLNTYVQFMPNDIEALIILGTAYNLAGDYTAAIRNLDAVIRIDRKNSAAYCQRGYSYLFLEEASTAVTNFNQAIDYNPNNFEAYIGLARAYLLGNEPGNAYTALSQVNVERLADTDEEKAAYYYWTAVSLERISVERKDPSSKIAADNYWRKLLDLPKEVVPPEWRAEAEINLFGGSPTPTTSSTPPPSTTPPPSLTPTETPVVSPTSTETPSLTPTQTPTPSKTPTPTLTPTPTK